jgi:hypothetical protein
LLLDDWERPLNAGHPEAESRSGFRGVLVRNGLTRRWFKSGIAASVSAWIAVSAVGIFAEWLQQFVGREASFGDGLSDVFGSAAGLLWTSSTQFTSNGVKLARRMIAAGLVAISAWLPASVLYDVSRQNSQLPMLASFEDEIELTRWDPHDAQIGRVHDQATDGAWALQVDALDDDNPGAILRWPPSDWSRFKSFAFDASCEAGEKLRLTVKVQDVRHNNQPEDRFQRSFDLTPTMTTFTIPLSEVAEPRSGRTLDLGAISLVQFYTSKPGRPRTFHLDALRLQ